MSLPCRLPLIVTFAASLAGAQTPSGEWAAYGHDAFGSRYAPLTQITRDNVAQLTVAWSYRTGEVGEFDDEGFLRITDRKKDLIITAGGKNIAPQNLENALKSSRFVSQAVVVGDRRPYVTALVTLDEAELGTSNRDPEALVQELVDDVNRDRTRVEQIKRFVILPRDFSQEEGEVTPTLKLRRRVIHEHFADEIEKLYAGAPGD